MGIFNKLKETMNSDSTDEEKEDSNSDWGIPQDDSNVPFKFTPPEDSIDSDHLEYVIADFYDIPESDSKLIAEAITDGFFDGKGYSEIARNADNNGVELERDEIKTIVWTELSGVQTRRNLSKLHKNIEQGVMTGVEWSVVNDDEGCSDVCHAISEEIQNRGGAVSVTELQEIFRMMGERYEDGTPERADDFIPCKECRCSPLPVVD